MTDRSKKRPENWSGLGLKWHFWQREVFVLHEDGLQKQFEKIQWNEIFCKMYRLVVIEVMSLSGHLSNIDEIKWQTELDSFTKEGSNYAHCPWWNCKQIQQNAIMCTMYGLVIIEVRILSGHLSNIVEISWQTELDSFTKEGSKGNLRSSE